MKAKNRFIAFFSVLIVWGLWVPGFCQSHNTMNAYQGKPYSDSVYHAGAQILPGKLQCEYYDFGGEGIAYHDTDTINEGSGGLNRDDGTYLNAFRKNEAVDISYTKMDERKIDNNPFNFVEPENGQLYIGWTSAGEWTKYTVNVKKAGTYQLGIMYTSNQTGKISISVNDKDASGPIVVPSTFVEADSLGWRQWHHWNYIDSISRVEMKEGLQTLTLHTVEIGWMNYDYILFKLVEP